MTLVREALHDIRTGRFERTLSALTAAGAAVTAGEIYFSHDAASFGNKMMWWPIVVVPTAIPAGAAGFFSRRAARTVLPAASAAIVINGLQGFYLHVRGIKQRPGGFTKYNMESGPPAFAPLLASLVGGMGLLAALLRREHLPLPGDGEDTYALPPEDTARDHPAGPGPVPGVRRAGSGAHVGRRDRGRGARAPDVAQDAVVLHPARGRRRPADARPAAGPNGEPRVPVLPLIDERLSNGETDGWHYDDLPEDGQAWRDTLAHLDEDARARHHAGYAELSLAQQARLLQDVADLAASGGSWHGLAAKRVWSLWTRACSAFYSHPWAWNEIGFAGPAYPRGYLNPGINAAEKWEVADHDDVDPIPFAQRVERARKADDDLPSGRPGEYYRTIRARNESAWLIPNDGSRSNHRLRADMRRYDETDEVDVVIVGAGAGGGTLAQRLAGRGGAPSCSRRTLLEPGHRLGQR